MASSTPHIVLLEINGAEPHRHERPADTAITPGDLCEVNSDGELVPISSAGKHNARIFALESPYADDPTQPALAQAYAAADYVPHIYAPRGALVYARLAASQTIVVGDPLISSATAGCLSKATVDASTLSGAVVGYAEEAVTTTGSTGRVKVRIA